MDRKSSVVTPTVTIIIVTYNAAASLQQCLDSIYSQFFKDLEIVIIDGASNDNTFEILNKNNDKIAYWHSKPDNGIYYAMNEAINFIKGKWVYFLGANDELLPFFSDLIPQLSDLYAIYYANVSVNGVKCLGELTRYQMAKYGPYHQAIIYPKAVFDKYKFDTRYPISADFALTLKLCGDSLFRFIYKDFIIAKFDNKGLSGTQIDLRFQKDKAALILKNFGFITWLRFKIRRIRKKSNPRA